MEANFNAVRKEFWSTYTQREDYKPLYGVVYLATIEYCENTQSSFLEDADVAINKIARVSWNTYYKCMEWLNDTGIIIYQKAKNQAATSKIKLLSLAQFQASGKPAESQRKAGSNPAESQRNSSHVHGCARAEVVVNNNLNNNSSSPTPSSLSMPMDADEARCSGGSQFKVGDPPTEQQKADIATITGRTMPTDKGEVIRVINGKSYHKIDIWQMWLQAYPPNTSRREALLKSAGGRFSFQQLAKATYETIINNPCERITAETGLIWALSWYIERNANKPVVPVGRDGKEIPFGARMNF